MALLSSLGEDHSSVRLKTFLFPPVTTINLLSTGGGARQLKNETARGVKHCVVCLRLAVSATDTVCHSVTTSAGVTGNYGASTGPTAAQRRAIICHIGLALGGRS